MTDTPPEQGLPPSLRFLKGLVITLMITMIVGVITVVALLVTRMPNGNAMLPMVPADLALPAGVKAVAVTFGSGWTAVFTVDDRILVFDAKGGLIQDVTIAATP